METNRLDDYEEGNITQYKAHPPGKSCMVLSRDGSIAYTGGSDSLVRVWKVDQRERREPETCLDANEAITTLAVDDYGWFSGSLDSHVRRYSKTSLEMEGLITRVNAISIRWIEADLKNRRVAVASDETVIKVIEIEDTKNIILLEGHRKGVRSATWHPSGKLLTSCGSDGKIIAWDFSEEEPKIEKTLDGIIPEVADQESEEFGHECAAVWHPSGMYFAVATKAREIITISRSTWSRRETFSDGECIGAPTALAFSPNGRYLISACDSGIFIWDVNTHEVVAKQNTKRKTTVHKIAFSAYNMIVWTDSAGMLMRWLDPVPGEAAPKNRKNMSSDFSKSNTRKTTNALFDDVPMIDDTASVGDGDKDNMLEEGNPDEQDDDWIIDDLGDGMKDKAETEMAGPGLREMVSVTKAQPAFQPGATPFRNKRRYLSFNNIGVVEVIDQDTHHTVNVEFYDQTTRKNYHFMDSYKYDQASIGERGIVYACPPEAGHVARVTYKPYATWASTGEWTHLLPEGEYAVAIAAGGVPPTRALRVLQEADAEGNGYVVVATNTGLVRFFSGGGMQKGPIWALDGDLVSMVAGRDYVFVVHREGGTSLDGNQNLKYTLRTSDTFRVMHTGRLPINKGHTLKWIGITDEGAPVVYDSAERLMILEHYRFTSQGSWAVLLDAKNLARRVGKDESYWPIGVSKNTLMSIILKGRESFPGFPRPLAQEIDIIMPYLSMDSSESQKEEKLARETILLDQIRDTLGEASLTTDEISRTELELDKELIQLVQLACKHDRLQRALDAVRCLHHINSFDLTVKIADFYHLPGLREKILALKTARESVERLREERARRADWKRAAGPVPPETDVYQGVGQQLKNRLQDTRPPPAVRRPRLAAAMPTDEPSPFANRSQSNTLSVMESSSSKTILAESPPPEKRKYDELDDFDDPDMSISVHTRAAAEGTPKRRAIDAAEDTRPQTKPNPFAKKPSATDKAANGPKPNPFTRKLGPTKSVHKSESFFEKVNAAESDVEKGKRSSSNTKNKKSWNGASKQTTLFAMGAKKKQVVESQESVETQELDEEETQESTFSGTVSSREDTIQETEEDTQIETQLNDEDEPIEWEATPPPESGPIEAEV